MLRFMVSDDSSPRHYPLLQKLIPEPVLDFPKECDGMGSVYDRVNNCWQRIGGTHAPESGAYPSRRSYRY